MMRQVKFTRIFIFASALALVSCGGLSGEARQVADACFASAFAERGTCTCIAKELEDSLSTEELGLVADLMTDPSIDAAFDLFSSGNDADFQRMNRIQNATERAIGACS